MGLPVFPVYVCISLTAYVHEIWERCVCATVNVCLYELSAVQSFLCFVLPHTLLLTTDLIDINFQVLKQKYVSILYPQPDVTVGKKSLNPQTRGIMSMIHIVKVQRLAQMVLSLSLLFFSKG